MDALERCSTSSATQSDNGKRRSRDPAYAQYNAAAPLSAARATRRHAQCYAGPQADAIGRQCAQGSLHTRTTVRFRRRLAGPHRKACQASGGIADAAIADAGLARAVADHKSVFFAEKNRHGEVVDYHAAVAGGLQLVPADDALEKLAADYQQMVDDGLFLDDAEPFEALLDRCRVIQAKANAI